jgi:hemerythrin-like domain-containing protein
MSVKTVVRSTVARMTMSEADVRALLHKDHVEALDVAKRMHESKSANIRKALLAKLKPALTAHSRAEEKVVYDALLAVKSKESRDYGNEGFVEHSLVDELLKRLAAGDAASDTWQAQAKVLHELLSHHIAEEQRDVFSNLGEHFSSEQLEQMGKKFTTVKAAILKRTKK